MNNLRKVDRNGAWDHSRTAKEHYPELAPNIRAIIEAFCADINRYVEEHLAMGLSKATRG